MKDILLVGFGGHAKSIIDAIERGGLYRIVGFTDIRTCGAYHDYAHLGTDDQLEEIYRCGVRNAFVSIGYMGNGTLRDSLYGRLKGIGFSLPVISDPSAVISDTSVIGEGTYIGKNTVINAEAHIGKMSIINTSAVIEHEVSIGDFSHIAVGAVLCGRVEIGSHCLIGANATVIQGVKIGGGSIVGAGSVVLRNINDNTKAYGVVR